MFLILFLIWLTYDCYLFCRHYIVFVYILNENINFFKNIMALFYYGVFVFIAIVSIYFVDTIGIYIVLIFAYVMVTFRNHYCIVYVIHDGIIVPAYYMAIVLE